ncbi:hypothetical protein FRC17_008594, partial [Serendipita sp. 399]
NCVPTGGFLDCFRNKFHKEKLQYTDTPQVRDHDGQCLEYGPIRTPLERLAVQSQPDDLYGAAYGRDFIGILSNPTAVTVDN